MIRKNNYSQKSFLKLIGKRIAIIMSLITLLIIFLTIIIFNMSKNKKNEYIIIDVFGRQRMLTQMISKDANRKVMLLHVLENGPVIDTERDITTIIAGLNVSMNQALLEFEETLSSLRSGVLKYGDSNLDIKGALGGMDSLITETENKQKELREHVNKIINSKKADIETAQAISSINDENNELLGLSDKINKVLMDNQKKNSNKYLYISTVLFFIVAILLIVSISQLYKYIVAPLNELYKGINNLGFLNGKISSGMPTKHQLKPVIDEINDGFDKLNSLIDLIENINQNVSFEEILRYIYISFSDYIPYSHIGIALLKNNGEILEASFGISDPSLNGLSQQLFGLRANIRQTSLQDVINNGTPRVINDLQAYAQDSQKVYNNILIKSGIKSSITLPLKINNETVGIIFFSSVNKNSYKQHHIQFLETLSDSIAISLNKNIFIDELLFSTILALAKMAEARDEETGDHLERMKEYSVMITEFLLKDNVYGDQLSLSYIRDIERFSPMHDIGKVGIKDGILLKPGKLSEEEYAEMKNHTIYGAEVLRTAEGNIKKQKRSLFKVGIEIAEGHHEKWDGSGYPFGKAGEDIPLSARIVAVADVFDALTSKRPYKNAFSFEESFGIIVAGSGKHFDPQIIESLVRYKNELYHKYLALRHDMK